MVRTMLGAALAAALVTTPVQAQDIGDIVSGFARQYLQQEQDRAAFSQAQSADTRAAYQTYLRQFPKGMYVQAARDRVAKLGGTPAAAAPAADQGVRDSASLTAAQRLQIQRHLNGLGYSTNGADGKFGPGTRRAIALWQRDRGYAQTGALNTAQANEILRGATAAAATSPAPVAAAAQASLGPAEVEADLGLGSAQRRAVQAGLTRRGYDTRGIDGVFGRGTRGAIAGWQRANNQQVTGYLTAAQYDALIR